MGNKLFEIENLKCDMDVLQSRLSDLVESSYWYAEDFYDDETLESQDEVIRHGLTYRQRRIILNQSITLLQTYNNEMASMLLELDKEIQKVKKVDDEE